MYTPAPPQAPVETRRDLNGPLFIAFVFCLGLLAVHVTTIVWAIVEAVRGMGALAYGSAVLEAGISLGLFRSMILIRRREPRGFRRLRWMSLVVGGLLGIATWRASVSTRAYAVELTGWSLVYAVALVVAHLAAFVCAHWSLRAMRRLRVTEGELGHDELAPPKRAARRGRSAEGGEPGVDLGTDLQPAAAPLEGRKQRGGR